jgi:hypothetical protein
MFPLVMTSDELARREREQAIPLDKEPVVSDLAAHVKTIWEKAKKAKTTIAEEMIESLRQRNGEYSPQKKAEIESIRSSTPYLMITNTKCRAGEAMIKDNILVPGQTPFDIEPTPVPELPKEIEAEVTQKYYREMFMQLLMNSMNSGQPMDMAMMIQQAKEMMPEFEKRLKGFLVDKAKEAADGMRKEINDAFTEGGWYEAINQCIYYFVTTKACILKGPVPRRETVRVLNTNPMTGLMETGFEQRVIQQYDCVSPFDIFPVKDSTSVNDGDLIERQYYRPDQLSGLIGIKGYNDDEIKAALLEYEEGKLTDWSTDVDQARAEQEQQRRDDTSSMDLTKIPCLEWWGAVAGKKLKDWGIQNQEAIDDSKYYHAICWLIGNHVIGATLNKDPNGEKIYSAASFEMIPGSFWGRDIPFLMKDIQSICNACARAIVNNIGIASGPQVEVNKDRFPENYDTRMWPWKVWESNESMMSDKPAITFYMPPMVVEKLLMVLDKFSKMADDQTIPAYAHGDPSVGGGGNTASGLNMLITLSNQNLHNAIKNFDDHIIATSVTRQFYHIIENKPKKGIIGDLKIVAKGSSNLTIKQQQAMRLGEFARDTMNPTDIQITGVEGRKYLLKARAQALNLDADKIIPETLGPVNAGPVANPGNLPSPTNIGPDGNPVQGVDTRMYNEGK